MLKKDELKILKLLFDDLTRNLTISDISKELKQKYVQTYRTVMALEKSGEVIIERIGNSKVVRIDPTKFNTNYVVVEIERLSQHLKKKQSLRIIQERIININENIICILFGSQVEKPSEKSDIDLLFVIPEEFNYSSFDRRIRLELSIYDCDINIVTQQGMLNMWANPKKFNVGNEILKKHLVLYGAEHFINLLKKHYVG